MKIDIANLSSSPTTSEDQPKAKPCMTDDQMAEEGLKQLLSKISSVLEVKKFEVFMTSGDEMNEKCLFNWVSSYILKTAAGRPFRLTGEFQIVELANEAQIQLTSVSKN